MGSSPLTRGKLWELRLDLLNRRLIPAHAGKTRPHDCHARTHTAHPRSRGENQTTEQAFVKALGSSPLTRGKLRHHRDRCRRDRLIPAHAGKTAELDKPGGEVGAHPRSRGENLWGQKLPLGRYGSSPLTRGKRFGDQARRLPPRLIPAHAGKTSGGPPRSRRNPAHPRSRGENAALQYTLNNGGGSSPLTRGKRPRGPVASVRRRLIPAHAGKTRRKGGPYYGHPAHPRSRGENIVTNTGQASTAGSSPLTRGKLAVSQMAL